MGKKHMGKKHIGKKFLAYVMVLAMVVSCMTMGRYATVTVKAAPAMFDVYPYATNMSKTSITLHAGKTGSSYQWQVSTAENGTYTDISGATSETYTFTPTESSWYRCKVYGTPTKAVQAIKAGANPMSFCNAESGQWYVTNGLLGYSLWSSSKFDVVGKYVKGSTTYWLCTSYDAYWTMIGASELKLDFDVNKNSVVTIEAKASSAGKMMVYTDTMLGNDSITNFSDSASLKAILTDIDDYTSLKQIQMVGAKSLDTAQVTDPAFVFTPITTPTAYFISAYGASGWSSKYVYNKDNTSTYTPYYVHTNDVVTEIQGEDSAMNISWSNLTEGQTVSFKYSVGDVASTGAVITQVTSKTITIKNSDVNTYYQMVVDEDGTPVYNWTLGNGGDLILENLKDNTTYIIKSVPKDLYNDGNPDPNNVVITKVNTAVDPVKTVDGTPAPVITSGDTTITITNAVEGYDYKLVNSDGIVLSVTRDVDTTNKVVTFKGLKASTTYYVVAYSGNNKKSDKVEKATTAHDFSYSASDNVIKAVCTHAPGSCIYDEEHALKLTLTTQDKEYNNNAYSTSNYNINNAIRSVDSSASSTTIKYYLEDGETLTSAENSGAAGEGKAPVKIGKYVMTVTVNNVTAKSTFKIFHTVGEKHEALEGTCVGTGNIVYYECQYCDKLLDEHGNELEDITVAVDGTNHVGDTEIRDAKEATDDEDGYTGDTYCLSCGEKIKDGTVIPAKLPAVSVSYHTHLQTYGDSQPAKQDGQLAGTAGESKRIENLSVKVSGNDKLGIQYSVHCQSYGWLPWEANGAACGTAGESKRLEAIKIQLTGPDKDKYDVYYRVHVQTFGWLGWAKNGEEAGTEALSRRLEGIQIVVVKKGDPAPGAKFADVDATGQVNADKKFITASKDSVKVPGSSETTNVLYKTHVQTFGWQNWKINGEMSGTAGIARRLEGINIRLSNCEYSGGIRYMTHIQTFGWEKEWKTDGAMSGTQGMSKRLEAIKIELTGEMAEHYDVYYRVHAQTFGWLNWASNGEEAGTAGLSRRLEGIQIVLVPKGAGAPPSTFEGVTTNNAKAFIK